MKTSLILLLGLFSLSSLATAQESDSLLLADFEDEALGLNSWNSSIGGSFVESSLGLDPEDDDNGVLECVIDCDKAEDDDNKGGFVRETLNIVVEGDTATALVIYVWIPEDMFEELDGAQIFAMDRVGWNWQSAWYSPDMLAAESWVRMVYNFSQSFDNVPDFDSFLSSGLMCGVEFVFKAESKWWGPVYGDNIYLLGVKAAATGIEPSPPGPVPATFTLEQNYPNPFNPETTISYHLSRPSHVNLEILNIAGEKIKTLVDGAMSTGFHSVRWDGRDHSGQLVAGGLYLCRMQAGDFQKMIRMLLLK